MSPTPHAPDAGAHPVDAGRELLDAAAALREAADELRAAHLRDHIGPNALVPYGDFLKAIGLSYDLGTRLRKEGKLKVLTVGAKLFVRAGHAEEVVRSLPVAPPPKGGSTPNRSARPSRSRRTAGARA